MKPKKVLLIRNVAPEMYGGGETYQLVLAKILKKYGMEPVIVTASRKLLAEGRKNKIAVVEAPYSRRQNWSGWRNLLWPMYYVWQKKLKKWYEKLFEEYRPSVINVQSRDDWIAATRAAKKLGIKVLWTDHMDMRSWVLKNVNVWYKNWIGKWILKCARGVDKIIMISDYERVAFDKTVAPRKYSNVVTIKNGVLDRRSEFNVTRREEQTFCYVGRVVEYKGIGELAEAFGRVNKKYPEAKLEIYGDGEVDKYKAIATKGVEFKGYTGEPLEVLARDKIFVLPSYREGLSLSLLDAAMMGSTIIASDVDGNLEVVKDGETGLLVPPRDAEALALAMEKVLENVKLADKMGQNVRKLYETEFYFEKIFAEKMWPLYNK